VTAFKVTAALLAAFILSSTGIVAAQLVVPPLTGRVVDLTATLTREQQSTLEQTLQAFESRKGSQIAVLIVPTTAPETIEQYALRVVEQWKLGRKKVDDGAILVVAKNDRALRIEVGYGLEGSLTDATSRRIIGDIITPRFKDGDFYGGISAGIDQMIGVIDGEPLPSPQRSAAAGDAAGRQLLPVLVLLAVVGGSVLRSVLGRLPGSIVTGGGVAILAWLFAGVAAMALVAGVIAFLLTLVGGGMGRHGGWYGGVGHHGGFGGVGRGGGFSGGGGGFGGGGSSGRW
jgi:uncharacterized protein